MELANLDEEETSDKEAIEIIMKKHRKLFRHLFSKYANTCYTKKVKVFESLRTKYEMITQAEFRKMLNDHKVSTNLIGREELNTLFRLINLKDQKADLQTLSYDGFVECFLQLAIFIHNKPPRSLACVPLVDSIKTLLSRFETATASRGESTVLYTDPEAAALLTEDKEILRELNAMVEKSPNYPLPEGYRKVQEKEIKYVYNVNETLLKSKESIKIAVGIFDEILAKSMGIHFLEPRAKCEVLTKVYPDTMRVNKQLKIQHQSQYPPLTERRLKSVDVTESKKLKTDGAAWPIVSFHTKIVVANMPKEMQSIGLEVGAIVAEIVRAVETGKTSIKKNAEIFNRAKRERQEQEAERQKQEAEKEAKRKQHQETLKKKLEEHKSKEPADTAKTEEKSKIDKEQREKILMDLQKKAEERTAKKKEEKEKTTQEKKQKEKEEKEKRQKEMEPFIKKKQEELNKLLKEKEEKRKLDKEEEKKKELEKKLKREKELKRSEELVKEDKEMSEIIRQQKEELFKVSHINILQFVVYERTQSCRTFY